MEVSKEIAELNDLLRGRWVSGLWNLDHAERQSDPKTKVRPHLWKWHAIYAPEKWMIINCRLMRSISGM